MTGYVLSSTRNTARILCGDGVTRLCGIKGKRIKSLEGNYNSLAAGDHVELIPTDEGLGLVTSLVPRRNVFGRFNEKGNAEQAIAANIDRVFCVSSPSMPPFRPRFVDRLAVLAEFAQVPFIILLNKSDLGVDGPIAERLEYYRSLGYSTLLTSTKTGEGVETVRELLATGVSVFVGQSGVGKSSLLNFIAPGLERRTQDVSEKYERGKHTTTMAEAFILDTGCTIIDTPGIRRLALRSIEPGDLAGLFPEMRTVLQDCALGSRCGHIDEEDCAVRKAAEAGIIHPDRYESYLRIREELTLPVEWKKPGNRNPGRKDRSTGAAWRRSVRNYGTGDDHEDAF